MASLMEEINRDEQLNYYIEPNAFLDLMAYFLRAKSAAVSLACLKK